MGDAEGYPEPVADSDNPWGQAPEGDTIPLGIPDSIPIFDLPADPVVEELDPNRPMS